MAKNKLSGITISIGGDTTDLSKALKEPDKEASDLQYKLSVIEKTLKMDPGNTDIIAQKFRLLGQAIENTEKRLDVLKTSQQQFISSGGDVDSSQYIELQRQIVRTSQQLDKLKSQRVDIDVKSSSVKSAQNEVDKLDKTIDDAEESSKSFSESFAGAFSGAAIADGLSSISEAMQGVVEDSKEYMKIMGALEVSSEQAGYTADQTRQTYQLLYSVMADDQTAATTTANLQAIGLSQEKLTELTYASIGAWAKYGDSIPIDGLAESINETIKAGEVTGTFADVLNWASGGEDEFNEKLANCKDASERANLVLQEMADQGLTKSAQKYLENNSALVENNNLQAEWQENMAKLSEQILPMLNDITEFVNGLIDGFLSLPEPAQTVITVILGVIAVLSALAPVIMAVAAAATALDVGLLPIIGVIAAIALAIAGIILVIQNWDEICEWFSQKWQEFTSWIGQKWQEFTGWFSEKADAVVQWFKDLPGNIWNFISSIPGKLKEWGSNAIQKMGDGIGSAGNWVKEKIGEIADNIINTIKELPGKLFDWGKELIGHLGDGIASMGSWIGEKVGGIADTISSWLHFSIPDKGPLREVPNWMPDMMKEMGNSIDKNLYLMKKPMNNLANSMKMDFGGDVSKALSYERNIELNNPIRIDLDGKPIYQNVVKRITKTQGIRSQFKGAY